MISSLVFVKFEFFSWIHHWISLFFFFFFSLWTINGNRPFILSYNSCPFLASMILVPIFYSQHGLSPLNKSRKTNNYFRWFLYSFVTYSIFTYFKSFFKRISSRVWNISFFLLLCYRLPLCLELNIIHISLKENNMWTMWSTFWNYKPIFSSFLWHFKILQ